MAPKYNRWDLREWARFALERIKTPKGTLLIVRIAMTTGLDPDAIVSNIKGMAE